MTEKEISLSKLLTVLTNDTNDDTKSIYLDHIDVDDVSIEYIIEFLKYKNGNTTRIPKPLADLFKNSCIEHRDYTFITKLESEKKLMDVYLMSDYLQIDVLLYLISAFISTKLNNKKLNIMYKN